MIFRTAYSSSESQVAKVYASSSECWAGKHPGKDALLSYGTSHTPTLTQTGTIYTHQSPHMHTFGMWKETRVTEENS